MSTDWRRRPTIPTPTDGVLSVHATALVGGATVALAARLLAVLLVNAPSAPGVAPVEALGTVATVVAAVGLASVGAETSPPAGVGLLFAGVFGVLGILAPAATLPAVVAVSVGTALFVGGRARERHRTDGAVLGLLAFALAVTSLGAVTGAAWVRPYTSTLTLLALGTLPLLVAADGRSLVRAVVALAAAVGLGVAAPFVTGALTLVGPGAVGTSLPVVAVAIAGVVTTASATLRQHRWLLTAGVALVALAGVPATLPRAVPFALGVASLATGVDG